MSGLSSPGSQFASWLGERTRVCSVSFQVWRNVEKIERNSRWLYCLILVVDANFRLKLKEKGIMDDPALGDGWAHWVLSRPYQTYVKKYGHQVEASDSI